MKQQSLLLPWAVTGLPAVGIHPCSSTASHASLPHIHCLCADTQRTIAVTPNSASHTDILHVLLASLNCNCLLAHVHQRTWKRRCCLSLRRMKHHPSHPSTPSRRAWCRQQRQQGRWAGRRGRCRPSSAACALLRKTRQAHTSSLRTSPCT